MTTKGLLRSCVVLMVLRGGNPLWGQTAGFAYVANCGDPCVGSLSPANVSAYSIDGTTGALAEVAGSPFAAGTNPFSVTVDPTGQFAYVANYGSSNVSGYSIDGTTGRWRRLSARPFRRERILSR